jgi:hypothetical protein
MRILVPVLIFAASVAGGVGRRTVKADAPQA